MFSIEDYKELDTWNDTYPDNQILLQFSKNINLSWNLFFKDIIMSNNIKKIEDVLSDNLKAGKRIFPYPDLVFSAFNYTKYDDVKVVIVGQDPYFKLEKDVPQAMGLSFSVPLGTEIPSSLQNIYKNMLKFGHITEYPNHGNLQFIAYQGVLFLNTALTVIENEKNSHEDIWTSFTNSIIVKLSSEKENIVFVLWGAPAYKKYNLIDKKKHLVIVSSHPSGLSCHKPMQKYPAFNDNDHFGQINTYLKSYEKDKIIYGI
jgi:uracil-DNA glycosylase